MISISRLLCGNATFGDTLRYSPGNRPIVVWNCTRRCNLRCLHCYANASSRNYHNEMDRDEARSFLEDLARFGVPVILFSGGEPLLRADVLELADFARTLGIRTVLSTNGTLITRSEAQKIRDVGFAEVGISLDGVDGKNDFFRGKKGAYKTALAGIRHCVALGQRVSLRFTISRHNYQDIAAIFELVEKENIDRVCFYHLAYVGRGSNLLHEDLSHEETRAVVDLICERTMDLYSRGFTKEVLTVDNHADGVYLYLKARKTQFERAETILQLLRRNGGNNSGIRIAAVDNLGNVHPDQFWWDYSLGNVRQRKFSQIWSDTSEPLLAGLRNRKALLKERCRSCQFLDICNGNLRVRALAVSGDVWAEDPACYLTDEEIMSSSKISGLG